ncbi:MAG: Dna2/Cas4 domain-containing protein [Alphaproteobacteria bacterium]|nr:Dna2/Cas4 domain-containing protein [Alphaproteobacteria bacterium]
MFKHDLIELPRLERIDGAIRLYKTPTGALYPSVTTVIGAAADKSGLDDWIKAIGQEEANKISARAARRGTEVHRLCEDLILNRPIDLRREMPFNVHMYRQLEQKLKENVDNVRGSELFLYSDKLKVAGACDLIADYAGKRSIIDFKTSGKAKRKEWIEGYWMQTCLYSMMFYEMTGIKHSQLVIMIAVEEENKAQIFTDSVENWISKTISVVKKYHSNL